VPLRCSDDFEQRPFFSFDWLSPTFREAVSAFERLYAPLDNGSNRLPTLKEAVHWSAVSRYGRAASVCTADAAGTCCSAAYQPRNLLPWFSQVGAPLPDLKTGVSLANFPGAKIGFFAVVLYRATRLVTAPPVAVRPPSTTNCPPVVLEARSEHRKSTMLAISSTVV
jgi:hypothetical protein